MDRIVLSGLRAPVRIGCFEEERLKEQDIEIDLRVFYDSSKASSSGEIEDALCYQKVRQTVLEVCSSKPWALVEELAEAISISVFRNFSLAESLALVVKKFVFTDVQWAGIEIERSRASIDDCS